ncbi:hypothetical protein Tsubulata_028773, partial [Turnera subulata]
MSEKEKTEKYVANWYHKDNYINSYKHAINPVPGEIFWDDVGMPKVNPPEADTKRGRLAFKRRLEFGEKDYRNSQAQGLSAAALDVPESSNARQQDSQAMDYHSALDASLPETSRLSKKTKVSEQRTPAEVIGRQKKACSNTRNVSTSNLDYQRCSNVETASTALVADQAPTSRTNSPIRRTSRLRRESSDIVGQPSVAQLTEETPATAHVAQPPPAANSPVRKSSRLSRESMDIVGQPSAAQVAEETPATAHVAQPPPTANSLVRRSCRLSRESRDIVGQPSAAGVVAPFATNSPVRRSLRLNTEPTEIVGGAPLSVAPFMNQMLQFLLAMEAWEYEVEVALGEEEEEEEESYKEEGWE